MSPQTLLKPSPGSRSSGLSDTDVQIAQSSPAGLAWIAGGKASTARDGWRPYKHLLILSDKYMQVATGQIPRLIVTMPPRHGKSSLISRYGPAWFLGTHPDAKMMLASYGSDFASSWGRKARDVLDDYGPAVFGVRPAEKPARADWWEIAGHEGVMITAGVGAGITGKGARLLVIDDPVKDAEEAASEVIQNKHREWWLSTARTRLEQNAGVILVMTRWHENDLAGQLLRMAAEEGGEEWEVLNLPAYAESDGDELGRKEGDVLCPELFDKPTLEITRKASGGYWWAAMYMGRPVPAGGAIFRRENFRYFTEDVEHNLYWMRGGQGEEDRSVGRSYCYQFVTVDPAFSEKQTADWTCMCLWGVTPWMDLLLLDVERVRFDTENIASAIRRHYELHKPSDVRIESKAYGSRVINELVNQGLPIIPLDADTDKVTRALGAVPRYEVHAVYHRAGADWLYDYERELLSFPAGAHDDQVDCYSYAALALPHLQLHAVKQESMGETQTGGLLSDPL